MFSDNAQKLLQQHKSSAKLIWMAMTGSILLCGLATIYVIPNLSDQPAANASDLESIFFGLSAITAVASVLLKNYFRSAAKLKSDLEKDFSPEKFARGKNGDIDESKLKQLENMNSEEKAIFTVTRNQLLGSIVCWALNESIAIFGVIISYLSSSTVLALPFVIVALGLNLSMYPRIDSIIKQISAHQQIYR